MEQEKEMKCPDCGIKMKVVKKTEDLTLFSCPNYDREKKVLSEEFFKKTKAQIAMDLLAISYE